MPIEAGVLLGSYEVVSPVGRGGMGEVWRARDTKLGREVAVKTLPDEFARDEDRLARFEREARVLASLNHPNIASIYGLEQAGGTRFLVLELIEGETLADMLDRGPVPPEQALKLGVQIAAGVEAAHEKGVVHRDLKPANIKITPEGKVKVLDFGLAKALQPDVQDLSNSPTLSMAATARGIILGTAAYMSPEQARGMAVDGRTDVWALGCVLYEMLTGRQAFRGEMVSDILASVLARDPDFTQLRAPLHPRIRETIQRCLEKDPKRRWQAIGDVRVEIERILASGEVLASQEGASLAPKAKFRLLLPWVAATAILVSAAVWMLKPTSSDDPRPIVRFDYEVPVSQSFRAGVRQIIALSPDGRHFAYNTTNGLFLRSIDSTTARLIPGTEGLLANPFFSPDGDWVAYFAPVQGGGVGNVELRKISIAGGAPVPICSVESAAYGASWGPDGTILFAQPEGIERVSANGGSPELVIKSNGEAVSSPSMLPDGKTVLYSLTHAEGLTRWDQAEIVAQRMNSSEPQILLRGGSDARYVPTGHLVYAVADVLFAVPFDLTTLKVKGGPVPIVQGVQRAGNPGANGAAANYEFSNGGALVYLDRTAETVTPQSTLGIVDRNGTVRRLDVPLANYRSPRASPDGRSIAVETLAENGQGIIWVYDLSGKTAIRRLTQEGNNSRPVWTPDSKRIAYGSDREKAHGIYWQPADGSGLPERLTTAEEGFQHFPENFSRDGRVLAFSRVRPPLGAASWALWTLKMDDPEKKPALFYDVDTQNEFGAAFSPDGKWIAYASNNAPDPNFGIYLQPYPPTGVKYEISRNGGAWPVWSPMGGELFYRLNANASSPSSKIRAVTISMTPVPSFTNEKELPIQGFLGYTNYREYDIMPNGREFVMVFPPAQSNASGPPPLRRISVVLNWFEELKARVPVQ